MVMLLSFNVSIAQLQKKKKYVEWDEYDKICYRTLN